jgi:hypothetical protein
VRERAIERMRCMSCRRPWARGPAAPRACPFCGSRRTIGDNEVIPRALPGRGRTQRQHGWLFGKETRNG